MRMEFCTLGPIPVMALAESIRQIEEQGWEVRFVSFGGMSPVSQKIVSIKTAAPESLPLYVIVCCKEIMEEEKFEFPQVKTGGPGNDGNGKTVA